MFACVKKSGKYKYLQIVENRKEKGKVKQRVIATVGRMDKLQSNARIETLIRSLSRFSEQTLLILSGNSDLAADAKKIGPVLIFERLWKETGIKDAIDRCIVTDRGMISANTLEQLESKDNPTPFLALVLRKALDLSLMSSQSSDIVVSARTCLRMVH